MNWRKKTTQPHWLMLSETRLGSINNPLTEAHMPFSVPVAGCYWIKLDGKELTQLPHAPEGAVLEVEVRHDDE